jgi:hypothetical protein
MDTAVVRHHSATMDSRFMPEGGRKRADETTSA